MTKRKDIVLLSIKIKDNSCNGVVFKYNRHLGEGTPFKSGFTEELEF